MSEFKKYVEINNSNIELTIKEGLRPMQHLFDSKHDNLPFFENMMAGGAFFGNSHHPTYSVSHIPGRWLNALLNAEDTLGVKIDETAIENLRRWAYISVEKAGIGLPACIDTNTFDVIGQCDLHNLREVMHAYYALVKYRKDEKALSLAMTVIETVDKYFDFDNCRFNQELYKQETGGTITANYPFPLSFGRYIGPLVKLYKACGCEQALKQAIKLKDTCFKFILNENGDYDPVTFGNHTHSTTAMISSLAQLGELLGDMEILDRVKKFLENGMKHIALDFGWCLEVYDRDNFRGEVNNTSDIMEACLILGKAGFTEYFARAERILRAHFLPSQLLDTHFIPEMTDPGDEKTYMIHELSKGAFGFPYPYGHEYEPGSMISFNWDIVGGAVGGLCEAYRSIVTKKDGFINVNLLFDYKDDDIEISSPYDSGTMKVSMKKNVDCVKIRLSSAFDVEKIYTDSCEYLIDGDFLYLLKPKCGTKVEIVLQMKERDEEYHFRYRVIKMRWRGESVIAAESAGKRLCYFKEM